MARIRARLSFRIVFAVLALACFASALVLFRSEGGQPWRSFQREYHAAHEAMLADRLREAEGAGDGAAVQKWQRLLAEAADGNGLRIEQIFLPDAGVHDLCLTCHMATENPLFQDGDLPLRTHPAGILRDHPPSRFGCTLCHHGQGVGLSVEKAHGFEENWPLPRVPGRFVQGLCLGCHETPFGLAGAETAEAGRKLFVDHGCFGCHEARTLEDLPFMSTPLDGIGAKVPDARWLRRWIQKPRQVRPRTRMPTFRLTEEEVLHIVAYLSGRDRLPKGLAAYRSTRYDPRPGKDLFAAKGCAACHTDRADEPSLSDRVPSLADAGLKLEGRWVFTWLEDPAALSPRTAMPRLTLTEEERGHLTRYLESLRAPDVESLLAGAQPPAVKGDPVEGKRLVQLMGCYGCHPIEGMEDLPPPGVGVGEVARKRLDELPFGDAEVPRTKWDWLFHKIRQPAVYETEDMPLRMPDYRLTDTEREALTVYYLHNAYDDLPEAYLSRSTPEARAHARGDWMLDHYNCRGCHQLEEDVKPRIDRYIELKSMVPPRLLNEGERVQPQWLFQYLSRPVVLRPWLELRMPAFGWTHEDRRDLIVYFHQILDPATRKGVEMPYVRLPVREDYPPEVLEMGLYRIQTDKCMQCHPVSLDGELPQGVKLEDLSINLMLTKLRLRYEWIRNFLRDPDRYAGRGTKMPFVYYTPDGVPRVSDPEMWIEYAALYLMFMDEVPEPPEEEAIEEVRPGAEVDWSTFDGE